jgi:hypothetical protein
MEGGNLHFKYFKFIHNTPYEGIQSLQNIKIYPLYALLLLSRRGRTLAYVSNPTTVLRRTVTDFLLTITITHSLLRSERDRE